MLSWILIGLAVFLAALHILTSPHRRCCRHPPVGMLFFYAFFGAYYVHTGGPFWLSFVSALSATIALEMISGFAAGARSWLATRRENRRRMRDFPRAVARKRKK